MIITNNLYFLELWNILLNNESSLLLSFFFDCKFFFLKETKKDQCLLIKDKIFSSICLRPGK